MRLSDYKTNEPGYPPQPILSDTFAERGVEHEVN